MQLLDYWLVLGVTCLDIATDAVVEARGREEEEFKQSLIIGIFQDGIERQLVLFIHKN